MSGPRRPGPADRLRGDRGTVVVEAAFAIPALLVLVMGLIDFGYIEMRTDVISSAARDGARMAITDPAITTVGPQTTCQPTPADPAFTAVCQAVARRLAGSKVDSVQVVCYVGTSGTTTLPSGVTNPNTQATCTSDDVTTQPATVAVTVQAKIKALTFVGQTTYGTRTVSETSRMALSP